MGTKFITEVHPEDLSLTIFTCELNIWTIAVNVVSRRKFRAGNKIHYHIGSPRLQIHPSFYQVCFIIDFSLWILCHFQQIDKIWLNRSK